MNQDQDLESSGDNEQQMIQEEIKVQAKNRYYNADGMAVTGAFFKNILNFKGRSSRREFWWSILFLMLLTFGGMFVILPIISAITMPNILSDQYLSKLARGVFITNIVVLILALPFFIGQCSLCLRRLRDVGHGKWLIWIYIVLFVATQILSLTQSYQLTSGEIPLTLGADPVASDILSLGSLYKIGTYLTTLVIIAIAIIALFPNKPFSIGDEHYRSDGQRIAA